MLAWRSSEDALCGFPPQSRNAHLVALAFGVGALIGEYLLHFGAVVAAKFGGQEAEKETVAFVAAAIGFRHVNASCDRVLLFVSRTLPAFIPKSEKADGAATYAYAVCVFFNRRRERASSTTLARRCASVAATSRPFGVSR